MSHCGLACSLCATDKRSVTVDCIDWRPQAAAGNLHRLMRRREENPVNKKNETAIYTKLLTRRGECDLWCNLLSLLRPIVIRMPIARATDEDACDNLPYLVDKQRIASADIVCQKAAASTAATHGKR